jgi:hypothetical protein
MKWVLLRNPAGNLLVISEEYWVTTDGYNKAGWEVLLEGDDFHELHRLQELTREET